MRWTTLRYIVTDRSCGSINCPGFNADHRGRLTKERIAGLTFAKVKSYLCILGTTRFSEYHSVSVRLLFLPFLPRMSFRWSSH